jgi:hypothetical protein
VLLDEMVDRRVVPAEFADRGPPPLVRMEPPEQSWRPAFSEAPRTATGSVTEVVHATASDAATLTTRETRCLLTAAAMCSRKS